MLYNLIKKIKDIVEPASDQEKLDKFIADQNPTSIADVEHLMKMYDRHQCKDRASIFLNYTM